MTDRAMTPDTLRATTWVTGLHLALILLIGASAPRNLSLEVPSGVMGGVMHMVAIESDRAEPGDLSSVSISPPPVTLAPVSSKPESPRAEPATTIAPSSVPASAPEFDTDTLDNPRPEYPLLSQQLGEEGGVLLRVRVTPEGHAAEVLIAESSGYPRLDGAAIETVARWRFLPARRDGAAVESWVVVPVRFALGV